MNHFQMIIPCGITEFTPMSMEQIIGKKLDMKETYHFFEKAPIKHSVRWHGNKLEYFPFDEWR